MNLAFVNSRANAGIQAPPVIIEVHLAKGLPGLSIVGLPETAVKESRHRVRSAVINSGFEFPVRRITVNLAPADLPKEGGRFDLPIALGILAASGQLPPETLKEYEFAGELALSGEVRACRGILPFAIETHRAKRQLIVPRANVEEALLVSGLPLYAASHLLEVCGHLKNTAPLLPQIMPTVGSTIPGESLLDLSQIQGQAQGRRALEIAAAGSHSLLMSGPPGSGKTMLAMRLSSILPPMTDAEALEVASIYSISRSGFDYQRWRCRPFRAPHHTASGVALVGGSNPPYPGEISLAHRGVLFLDELPEFNRSVLEALREPLEAETVTISRASYQSVFPAAFQLIGAMNPCPCGYLNDPNGRCRCTQEQVQRYEHRISGPLLDRIDIHLKVSAVPPRFLIENAPSANESSAVVRTRVCAIRERQMQRQKKTNAALSSDEVRQYCILDALGKKLLTQAIDSFGLSARAYHRVLKVARTIADLSEHETIHASDLQEALGYRQIK